MPKIQYQDKRLGPDKQSVIRRANAIIAEYAAQGFDLTLRQLYYQFVARGFIPNNIQSYKRLGDIINDARLAGLIDWDRIVDRTRNLRGVTTYRDAQDLVKRSARYFSTDKWHDQAVRPEVWIEKDALVGVIEGTCVNHQVDFFSCRGFVSQSEMWAAAQRIGRRILAGQTVRIIHLGDHDPSGIDMSRDIEERIRAFLHTDQVNHLGKLLWEQVDKDGITATRWDDLSPEYKQKMQMRLDRLEDQWGTFQFERIALNMDQVLELQPPPNPAKITDSRAKKYIEEYGRESWELDALDPTYLDRIITDAIMAVREDDKWEAAEAVEAQEQALLDGIVQHWDRVADFTRGLM